MKTLNSISVASFLTILIALVGIEARANGTEDTLQKRMQKKVDRLASTLRHFNQIKRSSKAGAKSRAATNREVMLRIICRRLKSEAKDLIRTVDSMQLYLTMQEAQKRNNPELDNTKTAIASLKQEIKQLKRSLGKAKPAENRLASR